MKPVTEEQQKPRMTIRSPIGPVQIDPTDKLVLSRLLCARPKCGKPATGGVWQSEGRLSEQQLCKPHYEEAFKTAVVEEMRKTRRQKLT